MLLGRTVDLVLNVSAVVTCVFILASLYQCNDSPKCLTQLTTSIAFRAAAGWTLLYGGYTLIDATERIRDQHEQNNRCAL